MDQKNEQNEQKPENSGFGFPIFVTCEKSHGQDTPVLIEKFALIHENIITGSVAITFLPLDPDKLPWFSFRPIQNIRDLRQFMAEFPNIDGVAMRPRCYKIGPGVELRFETDNVRFDKLSFVTEDGISLVKPPKPENDI